MNIDERLAEEVRLVYRHLYWATKHLANIYNAVKPEGKPELEVDPRQLSLFENESEESL
ncbi:MAG: hypothetical protein IJK84_10785 [Bacteroidales bacterium]|nr:hypothetical protein [Bacteroidales bacterium]MBQ7512660.1 hypothetical protein [Prevotella sp.]